MWLMTSGLLLLPLSDRWRFNDSSSDWLELLRSRRNAAAAAARRNNWFTVAPEWAKIVKQINKSYYITESCSDSNRMMTYRLMSAGCLDAVVETRLVGIELLRPFYLWNFDGGWSVCVLQNCQGFEFAPSARNESWIKMPFVLVSIQRINRWDNFVWLKRRKCG